MWKLSKHHFFLLKSTNKLQNKTFQFCDKKLSILVHYSGSRRFSGTIHFASSRSQVFGSFFFIWSDTWLTKLSGAANRKAIKLLNKKLKLTRSKKIKVSGFLSLSLARSRGFSLAFSLYGLLRVK